MRVLILIIGIVSIMFINSTFAQESKKMLVVEFKKNILDCPHFGPKITDEMAKTLNYQLNKKDEENSIVIFELPVNYQTEEKIIEESKNYLKNIQFPEPYLLGIKIISTNNKN